MIRPSIALKYYSRRDVQEEIVRLGKDRELIGSFNGKSFDKRPQTVNFEKEIFLQARKGITSFHTSLEMWNNPLILNNELREQELKNNRKGWDLIIDIDAPKVEYSHVIARYVLEVLERHKIYDTAIKYSGNKGFHLGISFNSFPKTIGNSQTKDLFPQVPRSILMYLNDKVKQLLEQKNVEILPHLNLDAILLSSRHLFRSSYSLHEKTGLSSVVLNKEEFLKFKKTDAEPLKVVVKPFLNTKDSCDELLRVSDKHFEDHYATQEVTDTNREYVISDKPVSFEKFPPCIRNILKGLTDGRKRSVFILINFLKINGYTIEEIENILKEWNEKHDQPLRWGYIKSQLNYQKRSDKYLPPPNCKTYYEEFNVCTPDGLCNKIKNPVTYSLIKNKQK